MSNILEIQSISKSFDGLRLFNEASLNLQSNTINSLFGGNGVGKTTLFNMITGFDTPNSGKIKFSGENIHQYKSFQLAQKGIGKMWQNPTIFPNHSLLENLMISNKNNLSESIFSIFKKNKNSKKDKFFIQSGEDVLNQLGLYSKRNDQAGALSYGQTKLLGLGMLICNTPKLFLLDEPFSNIGSKTIDIMCNHFDKIIKNEGTIFMIEHKTAIANSVSNNSYKIENQKIVPFK